MEVDMSMVAIVFIAGVLFGGLLALLMAAVICAAGLAWRMEEEL